MTDFVSLFNSQPTYEALAAAFDNVEADVTYIDDKEIVIYFSPFRIFDRPAACLNALMFNCHSPATRPIIEEMLGAFRAGTKDKVSIEAEKHGRPIRVCYQAMRTRDGQYLGCLEAVTYRDEVQA